MSAVALDTLKLARSLREKAKLSPEQAGGFADASSEALQSDLATKADVLAVAADLRQAELRLEAKIEGGKAELLKWVLGAMGLQTIAILGAVLSLARTLRP